LPDRDPASIGLFSDCLRQAPSKIRSGIACVASLAKREKARPPADDPGQKTSSKQTDRPISQLVGYLGIKKRTFQAELKNKSAT
jgi:hypothetical protein